MDTEFRTTDLVRSKEMKIKKIFTNFRVILMLIFIVLAIISIYPNPTKEGVAIRNIQVNSSAALAGIENPKPASSPMKREVISAINNIPIRSLEDYFDVTSSLSPNTSITVRTEKAVYSLRLKNTTDLGLEVYPAPKTNIRKGLDLQGGTRVLIEPVEQISATDMNTLVEGMKQRLNVYGLSDLIIREASDLPPPLGSGKQFVVVEIAGATKEEVRNLIASEGKFEAKIGNKTAFTGGDDIKNVCRSPDCAGLDPTFGCIQQGSQWFCRFRFSITLSSKAAQQQADLTKNLAVVSTEDNNNYLDQQLILVLDGVEVDQLNIGADLQGRAVTDISISGSGTGFTRQEAVLDSLISMKSLQTLLITGSLPVEINVVKIDTISPLLGEEFIKNTLFIGALAILSVAIVVFIRYRKLRISLSMVVTMVTEVVLLMGLASLIGWNIDLAAIAGIIIAVGTGVDHQIVITDETLSGDEGRIYDWKKRLKRALVIIMASYFTTVVAMLPLVFAGAGLLKGFAITTIIGVSFGVFITRPAYAAIIEILMTD